MAPIRKTKELIKKVPAIKPHLDLLAAVLTIPVLVTVIILNFSNLARSKSAVIPTPTTSPVSTTKTIIEKVPVAITSTSSTNNSQCTPGIGNITIDSPKENDATTTNPVCINISYQSNNHCAIVWAYRINGGPWSDYSNNAVCLYDMPSGSVTFDLQVKSLVNNDTTTLERHFTYQPAVAVTPSPTPLPTVTITSTPTPTP